jgi:hypothetical protein
VTTWHYRNGQRSETTFVDDAWRDGDIEEFLVKHGFEKYVAIGSEEPVAIAIRVWQRDEDPQWLLEVSNFSHCDYFTAAALPDVLDLLSRWAPIVQAAEVVYQLDMVARLDGNSIVTDVLSASVVNREDVANRILLEEKSRFIERRRQQLVSETMQWVD